jgi:hypothetical protein
MNEQLFKDYCVKRGLDSKATAEAMEHVRDFENYLKSLGKSFDSVSVAEVKEYVSELISRGLNTTEHLLALARYHYLIQKDEIYIYFSAIFGSDRILSNLANRLEAIAGQDVKTKVFGDLEVPPVGSSPEAFPETTRCLMQRLESALPPAVCRQVLAGNMHDVSADSFSEEKELFRQSTTIDEFLAALHARSIAVLEKHLRDGKLWYEQRITKRVIEFVKGNREILGGIRKGDRIFITKIPYAPDDYLQETDARMKRYYACHCTFVRSAIKEGTPAISPTWCYCSGGYEKFLFDVVFGELGEVEVLETALAGHSRCRFALKIPERINYSKT